MKTYNFGAYPTMVTPYRENGEVNLDAVKALVRFYHDEGCSGIFAVCQSSEIFQLSVSERVEINRTVYREVQKIAEEGGRKMTVVSSGHVSDEIEDQAKELCAVAESGTDALILITNRLAKEGESDDVWIANAERLLSLLPSDVALGLYECPFPYKRLLTPRILEWCITKGRFKFIKDTCCDADMIAERLKILDGTGFLLFNANCQTLLPSLRAGGAGYCGIMANYHPRLYAWLCKNYEKEPEKADLLASLLSMCGFTECGLTYPLSAKYHLKHHEGIDLALTTRKPGCAPVTPYVTLCMDQMKALADYARSIIGENL